MEEYDVENKAVLVWQILSKRDRMSVRQIGELTNYKESFLFIVLGWLLRENKISLIENRGVLHVQLNKVTPDIYY